jgi:hypothetical protein
MMKKTFFACSLVSNNVFVDFLWIQTSIVEENRKL